LLGSGADPSREAGEVPDWFRWSVARSVRTRSGHLRATIRTIVGCALPLLTTLTVAKSPASSVPSLVDLRHGCMPCQCPARQPRTRNRVCAIRSALTPARSYAAPCCRLANTWLADLSSRGQAWPHTAGLSTTITFWWLAIPTRGLSERVGQYHPTIPGGITVDDQWR
jgi:hypothetical protein